MKRRWPRFLFFLLVVGPLAIFIFGSVVMLLWNNVLTPVLKVGEVTFWQALGILVLSKILFAGFMGGGGRRYYRRRMWRDWEKLTPEEKERYREEWRNRCGPWSERQWNAGTGTETSSQI
jgi:hypothetical protein